MTWYLCHLEHSVEIHYTNTFHFINLRFNRLFSLELFEARGPTCLLYLHLLFNKQYLIETLYDAKQGPPI